MSVDELKVPAEILTECPRHAILLYAMCCLHADENGFCEAARWIGAVSGLTKEECQEAIESLLIGRFIKVHMWPDTFGTQTVIQIVHWKEPLIHERLPWNAWNAIRQRVFERDNRTCAYCLAQFSLEELECDHVEPISAGGTNEPGNLVAACRSCNQSKRAKIIGQFRGATP